MSFVGKVLVVVNLVMGVCVMVFAGAVATVQTNWKAEHDRVVTQLDGARAAQAQTQEELNKYRDDKEKELAAETERANSAEGDVGLLKREIAGLKSQNEDLLKEKGFLQSQANEAGNEATRRRQDAISQRNVNKLLHDKQDTLVKDVNSWKDTAYTKTRELNEVNEKYITLLKEKEKLDRLLRVKGINPDTEVANTIPLPAPDVQGRVKSSKRQARSGVDFVQVSLGKDDGVAPGHVLYITKASDRKYVAKLKLIDVESDTAVGTTFDKTRTGTIEEGDHVSTKF